LQKILYFSLVVDETVYGFVLNRDYARIRVHSLKLSTNGECTSALIHFDLLRSVNQSASRDGAALSETEIHWRKHSVNVYRWRTAP